MDKIVIPINKNRLQIAVSNLLAKGSKLEDLFLVIQSPIEFEIEKEFELTLQEPRIKTQGESKSSIFNRHQFEIWGPELVDVKKIVKFKIFFSKVTPRHLILDHAKFPYPKTSIRNIKSIKDSNYVWKPISTIPEK